MAGSTVHFDGVAYPPTGSPFRAGLSLTRTTLTVTLQDSSSEREELFVGVSSIALLQYSASENCVMLSRGNSFLFDNAALSLPSVRSSSYDVLKSHPNDEDDMGGPMDWERLTISLSSTTEASALTAALAERHAERLVTPPAAFPAAGFNTNASSRRSAATTPNQYLSISKEGTPRSSSQSSRLPSRKSQSDATRSVLSESSSRLPSRRSGSAHSVHSSVTGSGRLPSRRSGTGSEASQSVAADESARSSQRGTSYTQSLRSSQQQPVVPSRHSKSAGTSVVAMSDVTPSQVSRGSQSRRALAPGPTEREFNPKPTSALPSESAYSQTKEATPSHVSRSSHRKESPRSEQRASSRHKSPRSEQRVSSRHKSPRSEQRVSSRHTTPRSAQQRVGSSHRYDSPASSQPAVAARWIDSPSDLSSASQSHSRASRREQEVESRGNRSTAYDDGRSSVSRRRHGEQESLFRSMMKLQHHRLHFMQYLHKEMVHQAYLAEESKLKAATARAAAAAASKRSRSDSRSASNAAEEAARLKEIEMRLREVEALHQEAARERDDAARLRRDLEWRNEESSANNQNNNNNRGGQWNSAVFSEDTTPQGRRSTAQNGQLVVAQPHPHGGALVVPAMQPYPLAPYFQIPPTDADLGTAIVDRYVFGEEWDRIFPSYESDIRFNAQMDVCLALRLPRRCVTVTNLVVDRPGLRVTAEIRHDRIKMERDVVERRMNGCPFRFLQRFYDMRDILDGAAPTTAAPARQTRSRRGSRAAGRREDDSSSLESDYGDVDVRRTAIHRDVEDRVRDAEKRMARKKEKLRADVAKQIRRHLRDLENEEEYGRERVVLQEATQRRRLLKDGASGLVTSHNELEQLEGLQRAEIEVGAARQLQALLTASRRQHALLQISDAERERRRAVEAQERVMRAALNETANPGGTADRYYQLEAAERAHRQSILNAEQKSRQRLSSSLKNYFHNALSNLIAEEVADRAAIRSEAVQEWVRMIYSQQEDGARGGAPLRLRTAQEMLALVLDDEAEDRAGLMEEEARRRQLYAMEDVLIREAITRGDLEALEQESRDNILNDLLNANRVELERRINERELIAGVVSEEDFYRRSIMQDEQDAFDVIMELFNQEIQNVLDQSREEDDESPRRRRMSLQRTAKPFHYLTFSPEDMDYAPSAVLALEGMMGCAVNKNLEVVSISKPLPKVTDEELQFQAGDMILDVAGHSLHSVSHLREVLSNRAMQIQEEAFEEFPDVPEDELTTNPALQKYLEVLCEHHNYLVQVLRGCDIYQIIVKS